MATVTVGVVVKKVVEVLASSKKGRKFLLYTVGIVLFIVLLPLIALVGLFGFLMGGDVPIDEQQILGALPSEDQAGIDTTCADIHAVFTERGLTEADAKKAEAIYMACLLGRESDTFIEDLAECFENVSDTVSVYDNVSTTFSVEFTDEDEKRFDEQYGVTGKQAE